LREITAPKIAGGIGSAIILQQSDYADFPRTRDSGRADVREVDWLTPEHLADWDGLARALDRLSPAERCDAIYAAWLMRLNNNRQLILPIRNLLANVSTLKKKAQKTIPEAVQRCIALRGRRALRSRG
jgi:hypothetical protein